MMENTVKTEALWTTYAGVLRGFLNARVQNPLDADDLLQEILVKVHQNINEVRETQNLQAWLFRIAHNTIIDFYRRQKRQRTINPDDLWYAETDADVRNELEACVAPFIKALPEAERTLLTRVDLENQPQKILAAEMGIAYSTLKSRVQKARSMLRHLFEECCTFSFDTQGRLSDYHQKSKNCGTC